MPVSSRLFWFLFFMVVSFFATELDELFKAVCSGLINKVVVLGVVGLPYLIVLFFCW